MRRMGNGRFGTRPHRVTFHQNLCCHPAGTSAPMFNLRDMSMVFFPGPLVRNVRPNPRRTQVPSPQKATSDHPSNVATSRESRESTTTSLTTTSRSCC